MNKPEVIGIFVHMSNEEIELGYTDKEILEMHNIMYNGHPLTYRNKLDLILKIRTMLATLRQKGRISDNSY